MSFLPGSLPFGSLRLPWRGPRALRWALAGAAGLLLLATPTLTPLEADVAALDLSAPTLQAGAGSIDPAAAARGALLPGEGGVASVELVNRGGSSVRVSWSLELSPAAGGAAPRVLASGAGVELSSGARRSVGAAFTLPSDLRWGRYLLELSVSSGGQRRATHTALYVGGAADLEFGELRVEGRAPGDTLSVGERLRVVVAIANRGRASAGSSLLDLRFSRNEAITAQDPAAGEIRLAPLAAGAARVERFDLLVPSDQLPGSFYLGARADAAREVDELVEGDTVHSAGAFLIQAGLGGADLQAASVEALTRDLSPGQRLRARRVLRNRGGASSGTVAYALLLSADGALDASDREIWRGTLAPLGAGEESAAEVEAALPASVGPGSYRLGLRLDPSGGEAGDDVVFDAGWLEVRAGTVRPDLRVTALRPRYHTARPGERIEVQRALENAGSDAGPFSYTLVLSRDQRIDASDEELYRYRYYQGLGAGQQRSGTVEVALPADLRPGDYWLGLRLDPDDEVADANPDDDVQRAAFALHVDRGEGVVRCDPQRVSMHDGDTLRVDGQTYRLLGYDTPEKNGPAYTGNQEPYASRASNYARSLLYGAEELALHLGPSDTYGRRLAHAFVDGRSLAVQMVEAEHAYETIRIFGNGGFYELAGEILDAARGKSPPFEAPYRWRQAHAR